MRQKKSELIEPMDFFEPVPFQRVDEWQPSCPEEEIFKTARGAKIGRAHV